MAIESNLTVGERAQRKLLITVAEWDNGGSTPAREILGTRTEDSSIEFNPDVEESTDIRGISYTDINKTNPKQTLDPMYIIGGSELSTYLTVAALTNDINAYNQKFTIYIITAFLQNGTPTTSDGKYFTVKHTGCTIQPTSLGGDSYTGMPIEIGFSNNITQGTVDKLDDAFTFTAAS